jgi:hypothetical protein
LELNNLQLQSLDIGENQITASFAIFSHLKKLRDLRLDGNSNNGGNNFFGSLAFLKGCESLEVLSIHNQKNITGKLEDLPVAKLEKVFCRDTIFWEELEFFSSNFRDWRELK